MSYYQLFDYVSNSQLGSLFDALYLIEKPANLQHIYDFGNLVDCLVTEKHKFNPFTNTLSDQGREIVFTNQEVELAYDMAKALEQDPILSAIMKDCKFQHIILRKKHEIEYQGNRFWLPMRCKLDIYKTRELICDVKTTSCTTQKQFDASIDFFNYDRQGAVYIDLGRVDRIIYIGVSKVRDKRTGLPSVFHHLIERGDKCYLAGLAKYSNLAWRYNNYVQHWDASKTIIKI